MIGASFGNPYPIGKLVGILADENIASMILMLDPRNMIVELPRIVIVP
jgi:hypothetical protein